MSKKLKSRVNADELAGLAEFLTPSTTSPSGLRWSKWNGGYGGATKEAGDVAGSITGSGVYLVTLHGKRYPALLVLGKLLQRMNPQKVAA